VRTIDFYFDFLSPYAYLAWIRVRRQVALRGNRERVEPKPVLLSGLLGHWGQLGPAEVPAKRTFVIRDCLRIATRDSVPFTFPPTHPFRPLAALRAMLPEAAGGADRQSIADALWSAAWVRGDDISDEAGVAAALDRAGLEGAAIAARTRDDSVKLALRQNTEDALALGVFGVPTFIVPARQGTELIWGNDRLDDVFDVLDGCDPLDRERFKKMEAIPLGAERRLPRS
jgi:2-hydroxychromene-2-carboxylate isomerase